MDLYNVIFTASARRQLRDYVAYIKTTLKNSVAAENLVVDARRTQTSLEAAAGSLPYCSHPKLREKGFRVIGFKQHNYIMLYRIEGKNAVVFAVYHQRQDYQEVFSDSIDF